MNPLANPMMLQSTQEQTAGLLDAVTKLQQLARRSSARIAIKAKGKVLLINRADVTAVLAEGNYVLVQQKSTSHLLREFISAVAEKLEPFRFILIHRSVLINSAFVGFCGQQALSTGISIMGRRQRPWRQPETPGPQALPPDEEISLIAAEKQRSHFHSSHRHAELQAFPDGIYSLDLLRLEQSLRIQK